MCGIAGILDNNSNKSPESLNKAFQLMLDALENRGPDNRGEVIIDPYNGTRLYLGHQRLSIIDPGIAGNQPMSNEASSIWLSTNSEIYNFKELKNELKDRFDFRSHSDTEVLLRAYEAWGLECLSKIRGMFAFSIYDSNTKKLLCVRDRFGIKPLYFFYNSDFFLDSTSSLI